MTPRSSIHLAPRPFRRGSSLLEVCVAVVLVATTVAVIAPPLSTVGCSSMRTISRSNLATLAQAHAGYAADWSGRQFTTVPDDVGAFGGCAGYLAAGKCIPGVSLGVDCDGVDAGIPIGCGPSGNCGNFAYVNPISFTPADEFGAHRIPNAAGFQPYVDGRFYSPIFYAPDDVGVIEEASQYFDIDCGYAGPPDEEPIWSSYITSPASMLDDRVLSRQLGYKNPNTLADGYASPPLAAAAYPELKSHMIERHAIELSFGPCNPNYAVCEPFHFNQIYESRPLALMFDGSVRILSPREAMEADLRTKLAATGFFVEKGLWHRSSPFGANGVGGAEAADFLVDTSYHFLTGDGILGRDTLD